MVSEPQTPRRERERLRHRREILDAARRVLSARGVEAFTIEHVAKEAEFAIGSIYRHFASKEELIDMIAADLSEPLFAEAEALAASDLPFEQQLERLVRATLATLADDLPLIRAFGAGSGSERLAPIRARYFEAFDAIVKNGQREGVIPKGARAAKVVALMGLVAGFAKWRTFDALPKRFDAVPTIVGVWLGGVATATKRPRKGR